MHLIVKPTGIIATPALLAYVEDKMGRMARFLPEASPLSLARVELARTTTHHRKGKVFYAEINLRISGKTLLRAEAREYDIRVAFDKACKEVRRELRQFKGKRTDRARRGARRVKQHTRELRVIAKAR